MKPWEKCNAKWPCLAEENIQENERNRSISAFNHFYLFVYFKIDINIKEHRCCQGAADSPQARIMLWGIGWACLPWPFPWERWRTDGQHNLPLQLCSCCSQSPWEETHLHPTSRYLQGEPDPCPSREDSSMCISPEKTPWCDMLRGFLRESGFLLF